MIALDALAERVARGEVLSVDEARAVLASRDLIGVGMMADEVRRRMHDVRTTFVRVFEVHADAPPASLPQGAAAGEVRLVGRPRSLEAALAAVRAARALAGTLPLTGYTLQDLMAIGGASDRPGLFAALRSAGLDALASVAVDDAADVSEAVRAARGAGIEVARLTVESALVAAGSDDPAAAADVQIAALTRARVLQDSLGGFRAFAPLPRTMSVAMPTTGYDDVKGIALARMMVTSIPSIQVDWALYGPKLAQVALTVGADDVDGVAAVDIGSLGARRGAIEEIRRNIRAAGLEPIERDGLFRRL